MSTQNPQTSQRRALYSTGEGVRVKYTGQQQLQLQQFCNYK